MSPENSFRVTEKLPGQKHTAPWKRAPWPGPALTEDGVAAAWISTRLILVAGRAHVSSTKN